MSHYASVKIDYLSLSRGGTTRRAQCVCGWIGPERGTIELASDDAIQHERKGNKVELPWKRSCNRHDDCDQADRDTIVGHGRPAEHCNDECCEDCFGY